MKYITAVFCLLFVLAGCSNITSPSTGRHNDRSLKISVSADAAGSRTLYPKAFTKYVLSFSGSAAKGLAPITLENGQTSTVVNASSLGTGDLTITAKGYVLINGTEYEAAEGSDTVNISGTGPLPSPIIYLNAGMTGAKGFFTYSVSFPPSLVNDGYLYIFRYGGGGVNETISLNNNASGTIELAPGYYAMTIRLYNDDQTAGIAEIVHIYSNMETRAEYAFTEKDFAKFITLSGTVDVKVGGQIPLEVYLVAYLGENHQNPLSYTLVDTSNNTWSMKMAAFYEETSLYFEVVAFYSGGRFYRDIGMGVPVKDENKSGINFPSVNFAAITISGTVNIQVTGAELQNAYVNVYTGQGGYNLGEVPVNLQDGSWSLKTTPFDKNTTLSFRVGAYIGGNWFSKDTVMSITVKDQDKNIDLGTVQFSVITISGTVDIQTGGAELKDARVYVSDGGYYGSQLGEAHVNLTDGSWSWATVPFDNDTTLFFRVVANIGGSEFRKEMGKSVIVKDKNVSSIYLGMFSIITISGTVDIQTGGAELKEAYVNVGGYSDVPVNLQDGSWSWVTMAFDNNTTLSFSVRALIGGRQYTKDTGKSITVKDQNKYIDLGTVQFSFITISGTVNIQVAGATLQSAYVNVYDSFGYYSDQVYVNSDGSWSLKTMPFVNNTTLSFSVRALIGGRLYTKDTGKSITVKDQDVSSIDLGTVQFSVITLSGTINVTYNGGNPLYEVIITAVDQSGNEIGNTFVYQPGANAPWTIILSPSSEPRNIRFMVQGRDDYNYSYRIREYADIAPITVTDQSVSGIDINLGDVPNPDTPDNPAALTEAVWANGSIDSSYEADWYSINVTAWTTYYLWFNGESVAAEVHAFDSNGNNLFYTYYAWDYPVSFTPDSDGTVNVRVRAYNWNSYTGTYELIYSTASNRPVRGTANYVVTYNSNGGGASGGGDIPARNVASGAKLNKPADPVKDGYRFGGWYKEAALTNAWDFASDTVSASTTLYAKWNEKKIDNTIVVSFEGFGDESIDLTANAAASISRSKGQTLQVMVEGEWDGYINWYVDGSSRYGSYGGINIGASKFTVGIHTITAVVTQNGKPYSKELTFRVVY